MTSARPSPLSRLRQYTRRPRSSEEERPESSAEHSFISGQPKLTSHRPLSRNLSHPILLLSFAILLTADYDAKFAFEDKHPSLTLAACGLGQEVGRQIVCEDLLSNTEMCFWHNKLQSGYKSRGILKRAEKEMMRFLEDWQCGGQHVFTLRWRGREWTSCHHNRSGRCWVMQRIALSFFPEQLLRSWLEFWQQCYFTEPLTYHRTRSASRLHHHATTRLASHVLSDRRLQ